MKPIGERMEMLREKISGVKLPLLRPAMIAHAANRHRIERIAFRDLTIPHENSMKLGFGPIDVVAELLAIDPQPTEHNPHPVITTWNEDEYPSVSESPLLNEIDVTVMSSPSKGMITCIYDGVVREGVAQGIRLKFIEKLVLEAVLSGSLTYNGKILEAKEHAPDGSGIGFNFKLESGVFVSVEICRTYDGDSEREYTKLHIRLSSKSTEVRDEDDDFIDRIKETLIAAQQIIPTITDIFSETLTSEPDEPVLFAMPIHKLRNQQVGKHAHEAVAPPSIITASDEVGLFQLIARKPTSHTFELTGGLQPQVAKIQRLITIARNTESFTSRGLKPNTSVLLAGPPGTGKTMVAGIAAAELGGHYLKVDCSDVLNKWVGESEAKIRSIFRMLARLSQEQPVTIFFDEFDVLGKKKGPNTPDWMRGITNTVLTSLNELPGNCLAIAAVNNPDDLEPAIKREGRFSQIDFKIPDQEGREAILTNWIRYYNLQSCNTAFAAIDVRQLATKTLDFSGADLSSLLEKGLESHIIKAIEDGCAIPPCTTADLINELTAMKQLKGGDSGPTGLYL